MEIEKFVKIYLKNRPIFLSIIRAKELELFLTNTKLKGKTLDFGCGDGFFAKIAFGKKCETGKAIIDAGLDLKRSRIKEAQKLKIYKKLIIYNGKRIPFSNNYFQTVVSNSVLEHIKDLESVLKEIYRVLKPNGRFYCTVMAKNWEKYLFGSLLFGNFYAKQMRKTQKHFNLLTANKWQKAFYSTQFRPIKMIGYLDKRACRWMDFLHYVSVGSLISYKLSKRWVLFPWQYDLLPINKWLAELIKKDVSIEKAGAVFFVLEKR